MEWKSLILGIAFSVGIFAVKSGVGLSYFMSRTTATRARMGAWAGFAVTYLLVFAASGYILEKIDLMRHLGSIQKWIQSGMLVHLLMAMLMTFWGVRLLRNNREFSIHSKGWLLLSMPCPVCATVILFSLGFIRAVFPESHLLTTATLLYVVFLFINMTTIWVMSTGRRQELPESLLGASMLIIAAYFFLSVTLMPNIADIDKIYRIALYPSDAAPVNMRYLFIFVAGIAAAFLAGFSIAHHRIRRTA